AGRWAGDPTRDYEYTTNRPGGQSESGRGKGLMSSFQCRMSIVTRSHRSSVRHEANHAREPVVRLFDPPLPEHVESSRAILPGDIDVGERPGIALARHCVEMQADPDVPGVDCPIGFAERLHAFMIETWFHFGSFPEFRVDQGKAPLPVSEVEQVVHLFHSPPQSSTFGSVMGAKIGCLGHRLNCSRRSMRVEPFLGPGITVSADFGIGAAWLVIDEVPPLPTRLSIWGIVCSSILFVAYQIPLPSCFFFGQSLPRFVPQFVQPQAINSGTPVDFAIWCHAP